MNELILTLALLATGLLLGFFFFAGLWWTLRHVLTSRHPIFWLLLSTLVRSTVVLIGFYFAARGAWQHILVCLAGFIVARIIVLRLVRAKSEVKNAP